MRLIVLLTAVVLLGYGCSGLTPDHPPARCPEAGGSSLWKLVIGPADYPRFTGLLAVTVRETAITAVLLDGSGLKVLELRMNPDSRWEIVTALPGVEAGPLPGFMSKSLGRIFLEEGSCRAGDDRNAGSGPGLYKAGGFRPFRSWRVDYTLRGDDGELAGVALSQWWPVPELFLTRIFGQGGN